MVYIGGERFIDGIQFSLVLILRSLAGDVGLAYLLRQHDFFPGVYFPVASSWAPPIHENEGDRNRHLANYGCFAYILPEPRGVEEYLYNSFLDVARQWRIEALFLHREPYKGALSVEGTADRSGKHRVLLDDDPWVRKLYPLSDPARSAESALPEYYLAIGGPVAPSGVLTQGLSRNLEDILWTSWPLVSRRNLVDITEKPNLMEELVTIFEDRSPAPPYWNAPVFSVRMGRSGSDTRYGVNQLAFNCFLAHRFTAFEKHGNEAMPSVERIERWERSLDEGHPPADSGFWGRTLAATPHVAGMVKRVGPVMDKYVDHGHLILKQITDRADLSIDERPSTVLRLLCETCDDHVFSRSWCMHSGEQWTFWVRSNHLTAGGRPHEYEEQDPGSPLSATDAIGSFAALWQVSAPQQCDLLNAVWAVRREENAPKLLVPIFMRFNGAGYESFCGEIEARAETLEAGDSDGSWEFTPGEGKRISLKIWPETVSEAGATVDLSEQMKAQSAPFLMDCVRAPAMAYAPALDLLFNFRVDEPYSQRGELRHDWEGDKQQKDALTLYFQRIYKIDLGRSMVSQGLYKASRYLWEASEDGRRSHISPFSLLLASRLAELREDTPIMEMQDWVREKCPRSELEELFASGKMGVGTSEEPWWLRLCDFWRKIAWHEGENDRNLLKGFEINVEGNEGFSMQVILEDFSYEDFCRKLRSGTLGGATGQYVKLVRALGQEPMETLIRPSKVQKEELSVYFCECMRHRKNSEFIIFSKYT